MIVMLDCYHSRSCYLIEVEHKAPKLLGNCSSYILLYSWCGVGVVPTSQLRTLYTIEWWSWWSPRLAHSPTPHVT
jgi:hypothetical protein